MTAVPGHGAGNYTATVFYLDTVVSYFPLRLWVVGWVDCLNTVIEPTGSVSRYVCDKVITLYQYSLLRNGTLSVDCVELGVWCNGTMVWAYTKMILKFV